MVADSVKANLTARSGVYDFPAPAGMNVRARTHDFDIMVEEVNAVEELIGDDMSGLVEEAGALNTHKGSA